MLIEIFLGLILGISAGAVTGLLPGIHTNLAAASLLLFLPSFGFAPTSALVVFITSMVVANSLIGFIPSIFLGAPEDDNFLSVLPGHRMLKEGRGHEAVVYSLYGSLIGLSIILIFTPIFLYLIPFIFENIRPITPFLLLFLSFYIIFREKNIIFSLVIFLMAGFLGYSALNLPIKEPLLPLLSGLFGSSALVLSLKDNVTIPRQNVLKIKEIKIEKKELFKAGGGAMLSAPFCSIMPGLGAGHAATMASEFTKQTPRSFLVLLGAISVTVEGLSFAALYAIGRGRTGAAVAVQEILTDFTMQYLILILAVVIISGIISFFIALFLSKIFSKYISKINYSKICSGILVFLTLVIFIISDWMGIVVFAGATALGIFCILSGSRRINLMGCLLVPVILFYIFLV